MNNSIELIESDLQEVDLLLQESAIKTSPLETQALQARILSVTAEMPQLKRPIKLPLIDFLNTISGWFTLPHLTGAAALALTLVIAVTMWAPSVDELDTPEDQITQSTSLLTTEDVADFSVLSEQEANMDEYGELVWDELLLTEDELAFAML